MSALYQIAGHEFWSQGDGSAKCWRCVETDSESRLQFAVSNGKAGWYDPCPPMVLAPIVAPEPIAEVVSKRPTCWKCSRELCEYLDSYHGKVWGMEMQCKKCRPRNA